MPRISFTAPLFAFDADGQEVADSDTLQSLVGRSFEDSDALEYFGQSIDEVPIAVMLEGSGNIQVFAGKHNVGLIANSSLRSVRALTVSELTVLQQHVEGTWADGVGECLCLDGLSFRTDFENIACEQVDDGIATRGTGTRNLFPAIHAANLPRVRTAISDGEDVNAILAGTTTLGWAIAFANAPIAHALIDAGVDVHYLEHGMDTVLVACAASRGFSDADAASVARRLLTIGGFEESQISRTAEIATRRGKQLLLDTLAEISRE